MLFFCNSDILFERDVFFLSPQILQYQHIGIEALEHKQA